MKISQGSIEITEVPGMERIVVAADESSKYGVRVTIAYAGDPADGYGLDDLMEHIDALQAALDHGLKMAKESGRSSWQSLHDIPDRVKGVCDNGGNRWTRPEDGWFIYPRDDDAFGPFTLAQVR